MTYDCNKPGHGAQLGGKEAEGAGEERVELTSSSLPQLLSLPQLPQLSSFIPHAPHVAA